MAYEKDKDYMALMEAADKAGNYKLAAEYEQKRNEKIQGEGLGYETTSKYAGWLDDTDYGEIGKQQMALGASAQDVLDTYNKRKQKASGTVGMQQYENDDLQQKMWEYISTNINKPTFDLSEYTQKKPTYSSPYADRIDAALSEILGREDFSYDAESDPIFQQYRSTYLREGDRAMRDTLAEAAAGAGGMNSYALAAAQQANNYYGAQVADKIPELQKLAYEMYLNEHDMNVQDLGLLQGLEDTEYGRYRDSVSDYYNDLNFGYGAYRDSMSDWQNEQDRKQQQELTEREWEYVLGRDALEDSRYESETAYNRALQLISAGAMPDQALLDAAKISPSQAATMLAVVQAANTKTSSGGSGGSSGGNDDAESGIVDTMLSYGDDRKAYEYLVSQGLSQGKSDALWEFYLAEKENAGSDTGEEEEVTIADIVESLNEKIRTGMTISEIQTWIQRYVAGGFITQGQAEILLSEYR